MRARGVSVNRGCGGSGVKGPKLLQTGGGLGAFGVVGLEAVSMGKVE